ncbi:TPA: [FeFe] hydrogenase H-cluster maturation GTPase HydF [Candidatus Gastranaerophilales bacterium HUM_2]|nr:MAG TPA: [FeFe] hydrogenase H-cluster maturation GTPase HydF [Candidatus Gastranaerophilales bacterium HUM_2]
MKSLKSMRLHIGVFGRTNVGKSSLLNKITNQEVSIVSDIAGTTTDVVEKSMELLPVGPVTFLDTAGLDDETELSVQRIEKTMKVVNRIDVAVVVCDFNGIGKFENDLIEKFKELKIPYLIVVNKCDLAPKSFHIDLKSELSNIIYTSVKKDEKIVFKFKEALVNLLPEDFVNSPKIVGDLVPAKSTVILVIPIDKESPKGRIILPQVQTLRDLLDNNCLSYVVKESELKDALDNLKTPPALVVTDSQAFKKVSEIVPENVSLTSFSILFARLKGDLDEFVNGAKAIENLKDGDMVLILESCTHHAIEDDIGRVKIPNLLRKKTGKNLVIHNYAGHDFPDIKDYKLIIHCGACMTNRREVLSRVLIANQNNVPITNYGVVISYCLGILPRAIKIFTEN